MIETISITNDEDPECKKKYFMRKHWHEFETIKTWQRFSYANEIVAVHNSAFQLHQRGKERFSDRFKIGK